MRILLVTPTFLPVWGGAERLLYEVFVRLGKRHDVRVVTPHPPSGAFDPTTVEQLPSVPFDVVRYHESHPWERMRGRRFHRGLFPPFGMSGLRNVAREARAFRPDMVSAFYGIPTGLAARVSAWRRRVPMVLSYIGRDIPGPTTPPGWKFWNRRLVAAADVTTYISDYCRVALFGSALGPGVTVGNASQAYPPADAGAVEALRRAYGIPDETRVLFALQRLSTYKGVDVLIRSMTHLRDRPCTLLIAGDGADRAPLQRLVETEGLGDRVHLLGFIGEKSMAAHWALADVFAFHSYYETFGMVLAEAMHAGKPIVSVDCTAIPEVVAHEETGLLVAPGDPKAFAAAVRRLLDEPGTRERLAAAGRRRAEREFTWNRLAQRYEDVFTQAVKR